MFSAHFTTGKQTPFVVATSITLLILVVVRATSGGTVQERGALVTRSVPVIKLHLVGMVGDRVDRNVQHWLLVAPKNNPGLLDMFARRDAGGEPDLVPWAGEFVGKYLISGVQALQMSEDPRLEQTLRTIVHRLVELQADDGYLGPWPKHERLRGHWDLWGHYHIMLGLILWHEQTGDERAAEAARRTADLICDTFLDTELRVVDAGSHEMNMSVIHGLGRLYRTTGNARYLRMAEEILKDFEKAGDYYRTGLAGKEFYRTPRPRWESLHALQGLVELHRITGNETFRTAFLHHWASMRRFDFRNTGGFSSGERATGNPYKNDAIETCCVVAFQEVMIDALRLTGRSTIADDLERSTLNAMLGAQHPSGAWCTYNTPMAGQRIPSHIQIRFQAREDTPHLNCCSVNGPRGYGSVTEWGVMQRDDGLIVNYYGPMTCDVSMADGTPITIRQQTNYPLDGKIEIGITLDEPKRFTLDLRIPAWSVNTEVLVGGEPVCNVAPGTYVSLDRLWHRGDRVQLHLDMQLRYESGDMEQHGKVSLYRGPILLAADDRFQPDLEPKLDVTRLRQAQVVATEQLVTDPLHQPWLAIDVPSSDGSHVRLIDFASAGATTTDGKPISTYNTWFPADGIRPPAPVAWQPPDGARVGSGAIRFVWRRPATEATDRTHTVVIARDPDCQDVVVRYGKRTGGWLVLPPEKAAILRPRTPYYWKVVARNRYGQTESIAPFKQFEVDPKAPPLSGHWPYGQREADQMIVRAPLNGDVNPSYGVLVDAAGWKSASGPGGSDRGAVELDGHSGRVRYKVLTFPEEQYTVAIRVAVTEMPATRYGQVFSAWAAGMDDPLRLVVEGGKLYARIEAGTAFGTTGFPLERDTWYHVVAVKDRGTLSLYIDGTLFASTQVPATVVSSAADFAIGGNPHFSGPEFLHGRFADLQFYARALSPQEVHRLYQSKQALSR